MGKSVNKIRNADFADGKAGPSRWVWSTSGGPATWRRAISRAGGKPNGMEISTETDRGEAWWSQAVACARDKYVRIDAVVTCALASSQNAGGFVLSVRAFDGDEPVGEPRFTSAVLRTNDPLTVRAFFQIPKGGKRVQMSVGVVRARGTATVYAVRVMPMIEPEEASHILAIPPPPFAVAPTNVARRMAICSESAEERVVTRLLRTALGSSSVKTMAPDALDPNALRADAILLPDETPPKSIRSLKALVALAEKRTVVISLPAFAAIAGDAVALRHIEQEDDPLCARVAFADWMTRGFALDDVFTYGWEGKAAGGFAHRQFTKTTALKNFAKKHGFVTLLESMANQESTSERPLALYKPADGGGLFVLDIEPIERSPSTMGEPVLPLHLLLTILGHADTGLGQYVVPAPSEAILRDIFREGHPRFREFIVHDADVPSSQVTEQLVTIGRDDESFGLPLKPKPLILVRSGLASEDAESVYGCFLWLKQLIRMTPYVCPYAAALASRFRLAWVPSAASWAGCFGWRRRGAPPHAPMELDVDGESLGAVIDVVSSPVNRLRVVLPSQAGSFDHVAKWFPQLSAAFGADRFFAPSAPAGSSCADRDAITWRYVEHDVEVCAEPDAFHESALRDAIEAGAEVIRIEVPGFDADFPAQSIHRTNVVATALEHIIGLHYGLIAVNRHLKTIHFDGFAPLAPGEALVVDKNDGVLSTTRTQAG